MAKTPEGAVKAKVKKLFALWGPRIYYEMTVPYGYGKSGLDFTCCAAGVFFVIETKATDEQEPTARQKLCITQVEAAGGIAFVLCGLNDPDFDKLRAFLVSLLGEP